MMKKIFIILLFILFIVGITSNVYAKTEKVTVPSTPLELKYLESHTFDTDDTYKVTKAVMHTLQDNEFIIDNVDEELGFIHARKEIKAKRTEKWRCALYTVSIALTALDMATSSNPNYSKASTDTYNDAMRIKNEIAPHTVIFDSNINIQNNGNKTDVRFSVVEKVLENSDGYTTVKSATRNVKRHFEPELFQDFFRQVDKNLFLEKIE